jgi:hypothetical protein
MVEKRCFPSFLMSKLVTYPNANKRQSAVMPIRCNWQPPSSPVKSRNSPIKYLSLPLSISKLPRAALQPLADKVGDRLPTWRGNLMYHSERLVLIKMTLSSVPVYTSISIELPPWLIKALTKIMKAFLWSGADQVQSGKCLVAWCQVQQPLDLGGLGILDLKLMGITLCL